jgi:hypothetical protein
MRVLVIAASVAAGLCLTACQQSASQASETTPEPKKDLGRSQVFYQGQGPIVKLESATVEPGKAPDTLVLKAKGEAAGPGYTDIRFLRRIYPAPPRDGIYEVDVVATKPATASGPAAATPIEIKGAWKDYPKSHLKAVRFIAKANSVTVPLPAAAPAPAG